MENWELWVAERICEEVFTANQGHWPETEEECAALAWRFGFNAEFHPGLFPTEAHIKRHVIHLPKPDQRVSIHHPVYRHELAEAVLLWEGREPFAIPVQPMKDARHRVALLVGNIGLGPIE